MVLGRALLQVPLLVPVGVYVRRIGGPHASRLTNHNGGPHASTNHNGGGPHKYVELVDHMRPDSPIPSPTTVSVLAVTGTGIW